MRIFSLKTLSNSEVRLNLFNEFIRYRNDSFFVSFTKYLNLHPINITNLQSNQLTQSNQFDE